jgi:hypothetical protein
MKHVVKMLLIPLMIIGAFVWADTQTQTAPKGKPLPADGGEPGKAYMDYCKAIQAGDKAALKKLVSAERAKEMESPEFEKMFPLIQSMMAKDIKVTGGTIQNNNATLTAEGKSAMGGEVSKGTIDMVLEGKQWKVAQDSWKTEMK